MQPTAVLLAALAAAFSTATPLSPRGSDTKDWTIESFTRTCTITPNSCTYSYGINTDNGTTLTACKYKVVGSTTVPANQTAYQETCGAFAIGSTWSGQFGPGNGFQTLSVMNNNQIIFPAYSDSQIKNGVPVTPDMSWPVMTVGQ